MENDIPNNLSDLEKSFRDFAETAQEVENIASKYQNALIEIVQHNISWSPGDHEELDLANAYADLKDIARKALGIK